MSTTRTLITVLVAATLAATACSATTEGQAVSIYDDPFTVAGLPARGGPSGPRDGVPNAPLAVTGTDGGEIDALAANAISDIEDYWAGEYPTVFKGTFAPVSELLSWDPDAPNGTVLRHRYRRPRQRRVLHPDRIRSAGIAYLLPSLVDAFGPMSVVMVLAHEYGHAIQHKAGLVGDDDPGIVVEQQADCFAGAFIRHVAENGAPHFTLNTSDGLNSCSPQRCRCVTPIRTTPIRFTVRRSNGSPRPRSGSPTGRARAHG